MSWGGGGVGNQLLMLSPNLLKSRIPMSRLGRGGGVGGRGEGGVWWPTFDAESKFAKIPNSHVQGGRGGCRGGGWWPTFDAESKFAKI